MEIPSFSQRTGLGPVRKSHRSMVLRNGIQSFLRNKEKHLRIGNKFDCVEGVRRPGMVTVVARRQTYKIFGVGHNSFQDTRYAQEVTSCLWAAVSGSLPFYQCSCGWYHGVGSAVGVGGDQEDALGVIFFESMKHIIFNVFSCLLFSDSETPSECVALFY